MARRPQNISKQKESVVSTPKILSIHKETTFFRHTAIIIGVIFLGFLLWVRMQQSPISFLNTSGKNPYTISQPGANDVSSTTLSHDPDGISSEGDTSATASGKYSSLNTEYDDWKVFGIAIPQTGYIQETLEDMFVDSDVFQPVASGAGVEKEEKSISLGDIINSAKLHLDAAFWNNARKITLMKLVEGLSRYYLAYNTFPTGKGFSDDMGYPWIAEMTEQREMSGLYEYVLRSEGPVEDCGVIGQRGYCYQTDGREAIIYVALIDDQDICADDPLVFLWSSADNKAGEICLPGKPQELGGFTFLKLQ